MIKQLFILLVSFQSFDCLAQIKPAFKTIRSDEDYSPLKQDTSNNWYNKTKYRPLSEKGNTYISFGGELRYQYFLFRNEDWGQAPKDRNGYTLTRYLVHTDLHAGKYFRTFIQLQSSLANGKEKAASPVDENQLDLHQAFFDVMLPLKDHRTLILRAGRQELLYGSQRLVAVRDGPNNRQSFDAAKLAFNDKLFKADVFFSHYVRSRQQIFDDGFNRQTRFWGAYMVRNRLPLLKNADLYYFGLWKKQAIFDDGSGKELRHSIGSRIWDNSSNLRYDIEGVYQFGSLGDKRIDAWTFSINTSYKFSKLKLRPEIGLKSDWISGNKAYDDRKIQTFNPLFPRGGYFGLASIIGPSNLYDIHPSLSFELSQKLVLNMDYDIFWRYSKNDGIYGPGVSLIYSGKNSDHKYIGRQFATDLVYTPNSFLYFRAELTWFKTGEFLKDAGAGKNMLFTAVTAQIRF